GRDRAGHHVQREGDARPVRARPHRPDRRADAADFESQVLDPIDSIREQNVFAEFDLDDQLRPDLWKRAASFRNILLAYTPEELRRIERQPELSPEADPHGYSKTIQRPLNESPLNNMPNYVERDALQERRVELEEKRLAVTAEQQEKQ